MNLFLSDMNPSLRKLSYILGVGLLAVGTACLMFWFYVTNTEKQSIRSPIPQDNPIQVIYETPTK